MYKKALIVSFLVAVVALAAPAAGVSAKPQGPEICINGLNYAPSSTQLVGGSNDGFMAEGEGTIDCGAVAACHNAGLDGGTVTFQQAFYLPEIDTTSAGTAVKRARTAGLMQPPGEYPALKFAGTGSGAAVCAAGVCQVALTFSTSVKRGAKMVFVIQIEYTGEGYAETFGGSAKGYGASTSNGGDWTLFFKRPKK
jgi:hypothetical protein